MVLTVGARAATASSLVSYDAPILRFVLGEPTGGGNIRTTPGLLPYTVYPIP